MKIYLKSRDFRFWWKLFCEI